MEHKKTSSKIKKRIIFILVFLLSLNAVLYYGYVSSIWNDYEAIESFSGNREHFDHIVKTVLKYNKKSNCASYNVTAYGIYPSYETDTKSKREEIPLSKNDVSALKKVQETLEYYSFYIKIEEYGISFYRDEKCCVFICIYEDINVRDINFKFVKESSEFLKFKKIEKNWYNILPKKRF